ncbi:MAG: hypothetical protein NDJ90_05310 [Oligoflexia bacterium]|nr:hypothetical protein [Oligoflexia bacterium]
MKALGIGILVGLMVATGAGCSRNDLSVTTYQTAKRPVAAPENPHGGAMSAPMQPMPDRAMSGGEFAPADASGIVWETPKEWSAQAGGSMRLASFAVPGEGAAPGYSASIIALEGEAGGLVANVNRWRQQVGLSAQDEPAILKSSKTGRSALGEFRWFRIVNDQSPEQAMLVAVVPAGEKTLFVKLVAPKAALAKNEQKFLSLCSSLRQAS